MKSVAIVLGGIVLVSLASAVPANAGDRYDGYYRPPYRDYDYYRPRYRDDDYYRPRYRNYGPTYGYRSGDDFDDYVRDVQRLLNRRGYDVSVDGILGGETRDAVARFQARHGLEVDGEPGPQTFSALRDGP